MRQVSQHLQKAVGEIQQRQTFAEHQDVDQVEQRVAAAVVVVVAAAGLVAVELDVVDAGAVEALVEDNQGN